MNKKVLICILVVIIIAAIGVAVYFSTRGNTTTSGQTNTEASTTETPKNEQIGTAGSNIPLKDNLEEAKKQVEIAMKKMIAESYGDEVVDSKIIVTKVYSAEEEKQNEALKEKNLGPNEVAFEVEYELKIAEGVEDAMKFTAATGEYNEETRWVTEKSNLGILRPNGAGYTITDFGTGW